MGLTRISSVGVGSQEWPVVTAWVSLPVGSNAANPVVLGVGREGEPVGYYSGGSGPADGSSVDLWLRLDPVALARIPAVRDAVHRQEQE